MILGRRYPSGMRVGLDSRLFERVSVQPGLALLEPFPLIQSARGFPRWPRCQVEAARARFPCEADGLLGQDCANAVTTGGLVDDYVLDPRAKPCRDGKHRHRQRPDDLVIVTGNE